MLTSIIFLFFVTLFDLKIAVGLNDDSNSALNKTILKESLKHGVIPRKLMPYLNITAVNEKSQAHNGSLDFIIRDEDVADTDDESGTVLQVNEVFYDGNKTVVKISDEAVYQLLQKWIDQAASGLMSAIVEKKVNSNKLSKFDKSEHNNCTNSANTLPKHAKCVLSVLTRVRNEERKLRKYKRLKFSKYGNENRVNRRKKRYRHVRRKREVAEKEEDEKMKLEIHQKANYSLIDKKDRMLPFSTIAKHLTKIVQESKNKIGPSKKWFTVLEEIRAEAKRLKEKKSTKKKMLKKFSRYKKTMEGIGIDPKVAFSRMGMPTFLDEMRDSKVDSTVIENDDESEEKLNYEQKAIRKPLMMLRDGVKLGMMLAGKNTSNFDDKKISIISPQFMSIFPDEQRNDTVSLLSPSVLALHEQGSEFENEISLSRMLRTLSNNGQEEWMNFVLEASGVTEAVDKMRAEERKEEEESWRRHFTNENGQPMYFTKENVTEIYGDYESTKIDAMSNLHKSMSAFQMREMNETGYSVMTKQQISMLYGPQSPYNNSDAYDKFIKMREDDIPEMVEMDIQNLAREELAFKVRRQKDIVLSPVLFTFIALSPETASQPIVLSPLVFSPLILSPSALGPLIISPWIFSPLILSPRVLAPIIISPTIFSPIILSPLALSPLILSPAVAVPLILSPFVLTPFILSPLVMVPLILNPFCLSPLLGVPNTLSPIILSPFVLSPFILSPPFVNAFVLSPYALSPILLSDGLLFTAVLSPSWLSSL